METDRDVAGLLVVCRIEYVDSCPQGSSDPDG